MSESAARLLARSFLFFGCFRGRGALAHVEAGPCALRYVLSCWARSGQCRKPLRKSRWPASPRSGPEREKCRSRGSFVVLSMRGEVMACQ